MELSESTKYIITYLIDREIKRKDIQISRATSFGFYDVATKLLDIKKELKEFNNLIKK